MQTLTWLELLAAVVSLVAVGMAVQQRLWYWPLGIAGVLLYMYIFWQAQLYGEAGLQLVYLGASLYGWYWWARYGGSPLAGQVVRRSTAADLAIATALAGATMVAVVGMYHSRWLAPTDTLWADAALTGASIAAQWLQSRKRLENWLVWIVADAASVPLFAYKGIWFTAALFAIFTVLALRGYLSWKRDLNTCPGSSPAAPAA